MNCAKLKSTGVAVLLLLLSPQMAAAYEAVQQRVALKPDAVQREVMFETSDGWKIHGTLTVPGSWREGSKLPAALLLHSSMHSQMVWAVYPGWVRIQESVVTLRIDWRGRGKSEGARRYVEFTPEQRDAVALDVRAALDFLASQKEVDPARLGVVAEEFSVQPAVMGAISDPRVRALVLFSGWLDARAIDRFAAHASKSVLFIVSREDARSLDQTVKAYGLMDKQNSELWIEDGLGVGLAMGSVWRNRFPDEPEEKAIDFAAGAWLVKRLTSLGEFREATINTSDGWVLHATVGLPGNAGRNKTVPGVLLLPTALADRTSYYGLERELVANGIAVINLDWRGIGKSTNKGALINLSLDDMDRAIIDVRAALEYFASVEGVDPRRVAVLGSAFGAKLAMQAAAADASLKAVALLTPVTKPRELDGDLKAIRAINRPVMLVTGDGFGEATKSVAAAAAQSPKNTVVTYRGGVLGYELFNIDPNLERNIAQWFKRQFERAGGDREEHR
jgi:dienelactone hydrolase